MKKKQLLIKLSSWKKFGKNIKHITGMEISIS